MRLGGAVLSQTSRQREQSQGKWGWRRRLNRPVPHGLDASAAISTHFQLTGKSVLCLPLSQSLPAPPL